MARPPASGWFDLQPGDPVPWTGGRASVRSLAVYDFVVYDPLPGEGHRGAFVWPREDAPIYVNLDIYPGMQDVEVVHELEPVDVAGWAAAPDAFRPGAYLSVGDYGGEPEQMTLDRAAGVDAGDCPASGWLVIFFRSNSKDVDHSWVVLYDNIAVPRVAFAASTRRARGLAW